MKLKRFWIVLVLAAGALLLSAYGRMKDTYEVLPYQAILVGLMFLLIGLDDCEDKKKVKALIYFIISFLFFGGSIYLFLVGVENIN